MGRVNVYEAVTDEYGDNWNPQFVGWFDSETADRWSDADYNGDGSGGSGRGQAVWHTSGGRWVLEHWSRWQGEGSRYEYIEPDQARDWLLRNDCDDAVRAHFGDIPEEEDRRPGRPTIGGNVQVRLGEEILSDVDTYAASEGMTRAEAIRTLLHQALVANRPYTVTKLDLSTRVREIYSRHATLGAAVEALRAEQAYDAEDNGLPSRQPRVEHDGRPVDVEEAW